MADSSRAPARRIYPPQWMLLLGVAAYLLHRWLPIAGVMPSAARGVGWAIIAASVALGAWSVLLFKRAKTGIVPFTPSTSLVTGGPYRFSRNPMYVGMAGVLVGWAVALGSLTPWVAPIAFVVIVTRRFIVGEEQHLEQAFGADYLARKEKVRRWL